MNRWKSVIKLRRQIGLITGNFKLKCHLSRNFGQCRQALRNNPDPEEISFFTRYRDFREIRRNVRSGAGDVIAQWNPAARQPGAGLNAVIASGFGREGHGKARSVGSEAGDPQDVRGVCRAGAGQCFRSVRLTIAIGIHFGHE